jgi:hypothetical protein
MRGKEVKGREMCREFLCQTGVTFLKERSDVFELDSRAAEGTILENVSSIPRLVPILNRYY